MTINRYVLVDDDDETIGEDFDTYDEALSAAKKRNEQGQRIAVVEYQFECWDSELVWTPDGSEFWPPKKGDA